MATSPLCVPDRDLRPRRWCMSDRLRRALARSRGKNLGWHANSTSIQYSGQGLSLAKVQIRKILIWSDRRQRQPPAPTQVVATRRFSSS